MSRFEIEDAVRRGNKARIALAGGPGSGKTWTALTIATELADDGPILVIDTERRSASLYADVFRFRTIAWVPPYDPRELVEVVGENAGRFAVVVIDSHSHFWTGPGGTLAIVDEAARRARDNRFAGWKDGTTAQDAMVDAILSAPCHVITTMRSKMAYVQERDERQRTVIRQVGMAPVQRDGIEYEFTVTAQLEADHRLVLTKSRCSALAPSYPPGAAGEMGRALRAWLDGAVPPPGRGYAYQDTHTASPEDRQRIRAMAGALSPKGQAAFVAWLRDNRIPPTAHADLTAEQALACRAYLANVDDGEPGAAA